MDLHLAGARAIVTGGSRGIGRGIVESLVAEGCLVEYCARTVAAGAATNDSVAQVRGTAVDLEDTEATRMWIEQAIGRLGGLDLLVLNASSMASGDTEAAWQQNMRVEIGALRVIVNAAKASLLKAAIDSGDAAVVVIGSTSAAWSKSRDAYGAIKAALAHVAKGLSRELAPGGVRVNTVSPGPTYSEDGIWAQVEAENPERFRQSIAAFPLGRMATPEEIANVVVFLCSRRARFVIGANIIVDGGRSTRV